MGRRPKGKLLYNACDGILMFKPTPWCITMDHGEALSFLRWTCQEELESNKPLL